MDFAVVPGLQFCGRWKLIQRNLPFLPGQKVMLIKCITI